VLITARGSDGSIVSLASSFLLFC